MKAVKTEMGGEVFPGAEPGVELHEMHGLSRSFPPHFHDHYVIGLITGGRRRVHLRFPCGGEGEAGFSGAFHGNLFSRYWDGQKVPFRRFCVTGSCEGFLNCYARP